VRSQTHAACRSRYGLNNSERAPAATLLSERARAPAEAGGAVPVRGGARPGPLCGRGVQRQRARAAARRQLFPLRGARRAGRRRRRADRAAARPRPHRGHRGRAAPGAPRRPRPGGPGAAAARACTGPGIGPGAELFACCRAFTQAMARSSSVGGELDARRACRPAAHPGCWPCTLAALVIPHFGGLTPPLRMRTRSGLRCSRRAGAPGALHERMRGRRCTEGADGLGVWDTLEYPEIPCRAGVLLAPFAEYLRSFTDDPAGAGAAERPGRRGLPFLRRSLPPAVRPALPAVRSAPACHGACAWACSADAASHLGVGGRRGN